VARWVSYQNTSQMENVLISLKKALYVKNTYTVLFTVYIGHCSTRKEKQTTSYLTKINTCKWQIWCMTLTLTERSTSLTRSHTKIINEL